MAAVDYFLKIEGVPGESKDSKHKDEIEVESWSWGETQSGTHSGGGGGGAGKVAMQDFHFTMRVNKASPNLFLFCANGKHITKAQLTCRKAGDKPQEYMKVYFHDLLVSSYQTGGSKGDVVPTDQISLNFSKIEFEYAEQDKTGALAGGVKKGYDLKTSTSS